MAVCTMLHLEDGWYIENWISDLSMNRECFLVHKCLNIEEQPQHTDVTIRGYATVSSLNEDGVFVCMACKMKPPEYCCGYLNLCRSIRNTA